MPAKYIIDRNKKKILNSSITQVQAEHYNKYDFGQQIKFQDLKIHKIKKLLQNILKLKRSINILDIACGNGKYSEIFDLNKDSYYGVEISDKQITVCHQKKLNVQKADVTKGLPFDNDFFDIVLASEIIEHVFDTDKFLQEIRRVMKIEATLIITTPNIASIAGRIACLFGRRPPAIDFRNDKNSPGHIRAFSKKDIEILLKENGFRKIKIVGVDSSTILGPILNIFTNHKLFVSLAGTFIIKTNK